LPTHTSSAGESGSGPAQRWGGEDQGQEVSWESERRGEERGNIIQVRGYEFCTWTSKFR
jgi:hypothetical protein